VLLIVKVVAEELAALPRIMLDAPAPLLAS
jgi:hypothetical protein